MVFVVPSDGGSSSRDDRFDAGYDAASFGVVWVIGVGGHAE